MTVYSNAPSTHTLQVFEVHSDKISQLRKIKQRRNEYEIHNFYRISACETIHSYSKYLKMLIGIHFSLKI